MRCLVPQATDSRGHMGRPCKREYADVCCVTRYKLTPAGSYNHPVPHARLQRPTSFHDSQHHGRRSKDTIALTSIHRSCGSTAACYSVLHYTATPYNARWTCKTPPWPQSSKWMFLLLPFAPPCHQQQRLCLDRSPTTFVLIQSTSTTLRTWRSSAPSATAAASFFRASLVSVIPPHRWQGQL